MFDDDVRNEDVCVGQLSGIREGWHLTPEDLVQPIRGLEPGIWPIRDESWDSEVSCGGSRVTSGNWELRGEGKIVSERSTGVCHHLEIRSSEWDPFEEYFVITIARTLLGILLFLNWASLLLTAMCDIKVLGPQFNLLKCNYWSKVPFPIQTITICSILFPLFNIYPPIRIKSLVIMIR